MATDRAGDRSKLRSSFGSRTFVGRTAERQRLEALVRRRSSVLLIGAIGIGKTRLLDWVADRVESSGTPTIRIHATHGLRRVPFGALSELTATSLHRGSAADLLLDLSTHVRSMARGSQGVVFCVDDLPRLDEQSAGFLHQMVLSGLAVVVASARSGEDLPASAQELVAGRHLDVLQLPALNERQTHRLVAALAPSSPTPHLLAQVWGATGGNPMFITELLTHALEQGPEGPTLVITPMPRSVADVVRARLGRLDPPQRQVLETLTLCGVLSPSQLGEGGPETLDGLLQRGLIVADKDGARTALRLSHPLFGEALTDGLSPARRSMILRHHAEQLVAHGLRRRDDPLTAALALDRAGAPLPPALVLHAARRAHAYGASEVAVRLSRMAFDAAPGVTSGVLLSWSMIMAGQPRDADDLCEHLYPLAHSEADRAMVASAQAVGAMHAIGDLDRADAILARHRPTVTGPWRHELAGTAAGVSMYRGDLGQALEYLDPILQASDAPSHALHNALTAGQYALYLNGRTTDLLHHLDRVATDPELSPGTTPTMQVQLELGRAKALIWHGDREGCWRVLDDLSRQVPPATSPSSTAVIVSVVRGLVQALDGELDAEIADLEAQGWAAISVYRPWFAHLFARAAYAAARSGQRERAVRLAAQATGPSPAFGLHQLALARAEAEQLIHQGPVAQARQLLRQVISEAAGRANAAEELQAALRLVALGPDPDDHDHDGERDRIRARSVAGRFDGPLGRHLVAALDGLTQPEPAAAVAAVRNVARSGHRPIAADLESAGRRAFGHRWPGRAVVVLPAGAEPAGQLGNRPNGGRLSELTERETDVALRLASGATDAATADDLGISIRTVHAHVRSLFTKLGVTNRHDVAAALRQRGIDGPESDRPAIP